MNPNENCFGCKFCDKMLNSTEDLKNHIKTFHESTKEYRCDYCESNFVNRGSLVTHMTKLREPSVEPARKHFLQDTP